jgi:hypothetical protein
MTEDDENHDVVWEACKKLPEDYTPYGKDERWSDPELGYPDCSVGCRHNYLLADRYGEQLGADWDVCTNPKSHRCGLLTFEHQGCHHFEPNGQHYIRAP